MITVLPPTAYCSHFKCSAMSNLAPQLEEPFSYLVQRQCVLLLVVHFPVQLCALVFFFKGELPSSSFHVHLLMAHSRDRLDCFVEVFSVFFALPLCAQSFCTAQAVRSCCRGGVDHLCIDARFIRVAYFSSTFAPVHLLACGRISKKGQEKYQCSGSHASSLTTPLVHAFGALRYATNASPSAQSARARSEAGRGRGCAGFLSTLPDGNHGDTFTGSGV